MPIFEGYFALNVSNQGSSNVSYFWIRLDYITWNMTILCILTHDMCVFPHQD